MKINDKFFFSQKCLLLRHNVTPFEYAQIFSLSLCWVANFGLPSKPQGSRATLTSALTGRLDGGGTILAQKINVKIQHACCRVSLVSFLGYHSVGHHCIECGDYHFWILLMLSTLADPYIKTYGINYSSDLVTSYRDGFDLQYWRKNL